MTAPSLDAPRALSPTNTYVPIAAVLGAAIMAGSAVLWYQSDRAKLDADIRQVAAGTERRIDALTHNVETLARNVASLADAIAGSRDDRLSRQDLIVWCLRMERINAGVRCPDEAPLAAVAGWQVQVTRR